MREKFYKIIGNDDNGYLVEIYATTGEILHTQPTEPLPTMDAALQWAGTNWPGCTPFVAAGAEAFAG